MSKGTHAMDFIKLSTKVGSDEGTLSTKDAVKNISFAIEKLGVYLASIHKLYDYDAMTSSISNALDEFSNALINAGCNKGYVDAYKKWGDFGWSFNANVSKKFFLTVPNSLEEADSIMYKYCKMEEITKMIEELKSAGINEKDLEEACFDYLNQKYKSSVMMLFGLLDQQLINRKFFKEDGRLKTGRSVIGELEKTEKSHKENTHLHYLQFALIINCLITLFKGVKNFEKEPSVINRNFIMHGMTVKEVNENDCFKVLSALYSFVVVYPELEKEILSNDIKNIKTKEM